MAAAFPKGKLEVRILNGKDLTNKDFGKQDPFCKIMLGADRDQKTKVIKKGGSDVSWQEIFMFETGEEGANDIVIEVFDHDKLSNDLIGKVSIPLTEFVENCEEVKWYPVMNKGNNEGMISLSGEFNPYVAGQLYVHLHKGEALPNKDIGKQDPYVKFDIDGKQEKKSSVVAKGGKNPEWEDEKLAFEIEGNEKWLTMRVYDEDIGRDDFVAGARFNLRKAKLAAKHETGEMLIKLGQGDTYNEKKGGNLVISMEFVPAE